MDYVNVACARSVTIFSIGGKINSTRFEFYVVTCSHFCALKLKQETKQAAPKCLYLRVAAVGHN